MPLVSKRRSRTARSGLCFPVARVARHLRRGRYANRISAGASVYLAGALEYLVAELLEVAGNVARASKKARIVPRHIQLAALNDEEFEKMLRNTTMRQGGVLPKIHAALLPKP